MSDKKGLVVGGGGARGAWAVGALWYLMKDKGERYDVVAGTSTGSLIAPLAALGDYEGLKTNYLTTKWSDIFGTRVPFHGEAPNAIWALLAGKDSVYTTGPLHNSVLTRLLTPANWSKLIAPSQTCEVWVSTVNLRTGEKVYFSPRQDGMTREKFASAIVAACSIPIVMSKNKIVGEPDWFVDGGAKDMVPLGQAIRRGATDLRVITMGTDPLVTAGEYPHLMDMALRTMELEEEETTANDLDTCKLVSLELDWRARLRSNLLANGVTAPAIDGAFQQTSQACEPLSSGDGTIYKPVRYRRLTPTSPIGPTHQFDEQMMSQYFHDGYAFASAKDPITGKEEINWQVVPEG
jgi:NTE family protein